MPTYVETGVEADSPRGRIHHDQTPHAQAEVYVVIRGRGVLFHDGKRDAFESGDPLFVATGTEHRFEVFSEDLVVWRVFYGTQGGELPA